MNQKKENKIAHIILTVLVGAFIGIGAILPGLSGGAMCVLFGIYRPLMETISHPFVGVKKHWRLLLPTCIGIVIGFVGFASVMNTLMKKDAILMQCIFLGLLLGTIPSIWKEAGETKRTRSSWAALGIMFVVVLFVLSLFAVDKAPEEADNNAELETVQTQIDNGSEEEKETAESTQMARFIKKNFLPDIDISVKADFIGFIVVGVCFALSIVMPGMSFSSPLICLGLYTPMNTNFTKLASLDFSVFPSFVLPVGIGALATVIIFAKPMNYLFEKKTSIGYHLVMGAVFASTVLLIPIEFNGTMHALWCMLALAGGAVAGYFLEVVQGKIKAEKA